MTRTSQTPDLTITLIAEIAAISATPGNLFKLDASTT